MRTRIRMYQWLLAAILVALTVFRAANPVGKRIGTLTKRRWVRCRNTVLASGNKACRGAPDDFVVYLVESQDFRDWNPVFLYFAQRRGYNVTTRRIERHPSILSPLEARYGSSSGRFVVFCPAKAAPRLAPLIESQGARLVEAGPSGWLYRMKASSRRRDQRSSRQIETTGPGRSTLPGR